MHRSQGQDGDGDRRAGHVDGGAQGDGHRIGFLVQTQTLAQLQVDRDVGGRAASEEGGDAALAQAGEHQRIRVAAQLPIHQRRVDQQRHQQHAADQYHQQVQVAEQGVEAGLGQGRGNQAEDAQWRQTDHQLDDGSHTVGQFAQQLFATGAGMAEGEAEADSPGQDTDEVTIQQGIDRVVDHVHQQRLEHLADAAGGRQFSSLAAQYQRRREGEAGHHRDQGGAEGTDQVHQQDRADMRLLALLVVGDGRHHQDEHQYRGDGLERRDEHVTDEADGQCCLRGDYGQSDTCQQADDDLCHQAGAVE